MAGLENVIVVKIGSSTLVGEDGRLDASYLSSFANQIDQLRKAGWKPIVVSSGAIACGLPLLGMARRPSDLPTLQAAASVGQNLLVSAYAEAFAPHGIVTSIVLITRQTTRHRDSYLHARDTLQRLLELDVVPVINENDTVSTEQIRFGDNDTLAALVACLVRARLCVIFSDIDGLHAKSPSEDPNAPLIDRVERIDANVLAMAGGTGSVVGSGGMVTKLRAARVLMAAGADMVVCSGTEPDALVRIVQGQSVGTRFSAPCRFHDITSKKLWIALGDNPSGTLVVDAGAHDALVSGGSSLLAVGVRSVEGSFQVGDVVDIKDANGFLFARGLVGAPSSEVSLACGRSSKEIEANELLRNLAQRPVVHRDELVVFE